MNDIIWIMYKWIAYHGFTKRKLHWQREVESKITHRGGFEWLIPSYIEIFITQLLLWKIIFTRYYVQ